MQQGNAIEVKNITKKFKVYYDKGSQLKERLLFKSRNRYEERKVLNDISFDVKKGEAIGLIGHNGCGKSTTLKLLTRIIYPDSGTIELAGRVSSLIELGAGFHPDMSGRENIYTNAAIFGLTKKEIDARVDDIIAFSELAAFIDNPVRTYSSGMYMRLAFSVAINVDADILLIDEILAVGDVSFQQKCFEKLKEIKKNGTTIVVVSHSLGQIEQICERSLWIDNGCVREEGIPKYVHEKYLAYMEQERIARIQQGYVDKTENIDIKEQEENEEIKESNIESGDHLDNNNSLPSFCDSNAIRMGNKKVEFINVTIDSTNREGNRVFYTGDTIRIFIEYRQNEPDIEGNFGIGIFRDDGIYCYGTNVDIEFNHLVKLNRTGVITIIIDDINLMHGKYLLDVAVHSKDSFEVYDDIRNVKEFQIFTIKRDDGLTRLNTKWYSDDKQLMRED